MAMADFNYEDFEPSHQREIDKTMLVKFYYKNMKNSSKSKEMGRPVFREVLFIDIKAPGSRDGAARPAREADINRFPLHHDAFIKRITLPVEGTPLSEWPQVTRSLVEEMAFLNIKTVEQLAALPDSSAGQFMGALTLKQKAKDFLARSRDDLTEEKLQQELSSRDKMIEKMQAQIEKLNDALDAAPKRRKSRAKRVNALLPEEETTDPSLMDQVDGQLEDTDPLSPAIRNVLED